MTVLLIILAAIALALAVLRVARGHATHVAGFDSLQGLTEALDLPAFVNLVDPGEEDFLRVSLPPGVFRRVQRQRLLAATHYVKCAARNAAVLVRLGEAVRQEANPEALRAGQQLVTAAIQLRLFACLALGSLYLKFVLPNTRFSSLQIARQYESLVDQVGQLVNHKAPAQSGRVLQSL